jgi:hypothetical protein
MNILNQVDFFLSLAGLDDEIAKLTSSPETI